MPKKKIKKSISKRFKVTKTGKVLFGHQYDSHLRSGKSKKRIRRQRIPGVLSNTIGRKVKKMLGVR